MRKPFELLVFDERFTIHATGEHVKDMIELSKANDAISQDKAYFASNEGAWIDSIGALKNERDQLQLEVESLNRQLADHVTSLNKPLFTIFYATDFLGLQGSDNQFLDEKQAHEVAERANELANLRGERVTYCIGDIYPSWSTLNSDDKDCSKCVEEGLLVSRRALQY